MGVTVIPDAHVADVWTGDPYSDEQTITDVGLRYAGTDMTPYRLGR